MGCLHISILILGLLHLLSLGRDTSDLIDMSSSWTAMLQWLQQMTVRFNRRKPRKDGAHRYFPREFGLLWQSLGGSLPALVSVIVHPGDVVVLDLRRLECHSLSEWCSLQSVECALFHELVWSHQVELTFVLGEPDDWSAGLAFKPCQVLWCGESLCPSHGLLISIETSQED